jgi:hypothetical protein
MRILYVGFSDLAFFRVLIRALFMALLYSVLQLQSVMFKTIRNLQIKFIHDLVLSTEDSVLFSRFI